MLAIINRFPVNVSNVKRKINNAAKRREIITKSTIISKTQQTEYGPKINAVIVEVCGTDDRLGRGKVSYTIELVKYPWVT